MRSGLPIQYLGAPAPHSTSPRSLAGEGEGVRGGAASAAVHFPSPVRGRSGSGWGRGHLPRLHEARNAQVRHREADEPGLGLGANAGRAFVADLAARTGRRAGKRRDRGRVVVRLHFHQRVRQFRRRAVLAVAARVEAVDRRALHHGRVVGIGDDGAARVRAMRCADHAEEALVLPRAIDDPVRVEDLVPAVLRVGLREHHELDVGRITAEPPEAGVQVFDLVRRQREAELPVRALERGAAVGVQRDCRQRPRRHVDEQPRRVREVGKDGLDHAVVDERQERRAVLRRQRRARAAAHAKHDAALDARDRGQAAVARDVGRLRGPRRDRPRARNDEDQRTVDVRVGGGFGTVGEQRFERGALVRGQRARDFDEMPVRGIERVDPMGGPGLRQALQQLGEPERRERRPARQR